MLNKILLGLTVLIVCFALSAIYAPVSTPDSRGLTEKHVSVERTTALDSVSNSERTIVKEKALETAVPLNNESNLSEVLITASEPEDATDTTPTLEMLVDKAAVMEADLLMGYQPVDENARQRLEEELRLAKNAVSAEDKLPRIMPLTDEGELVIPQQGELPNQAISIHATMDQL